MHRFSLHVCKQWYSLYVEIIGVIYKIQASMWVTCIGTFLINEEPMFKHIITTPILITISPLLSMIPLFSPILLSLPLLLPLYSGA
jgi:hypothetical protein